jgi:hypothetical protein
MAYTINNYNGDIVATVDDGTVNNALDIALIGKNYSGYGEAQNENFVYLLANFARPSEPGKAVTGQLWYDTDTQKIKVFTGQLSGTAKIWKSLTGSEYSATEPSSSTSTNGDLWFDTTEKKLKVRTLNGLTAVWKSVGPGIVPVYADATARNADQPLSGPVTGSLCLTGTVFQGYNGTDWVNLT